MLHVDTRTLLVVVILVGVLCSFVAAFLKSVGAKMSASCVLMIVSTIILAELHTSGKRDGSETPIL